LNRGKRCGAWPPERWSIRERGELAFAVQSDGTPHAEHAARETVSRRGFASLRLEF
jgi:hypothetical protein